MKAPVRYRCLSAKTELIIIEKMTMSMPSTTISIAASIAIISLISAGLYFTNPEPITSLSLDNTVPIATTRLAVQDTQLQQVLPENNLVPTNVEISENPEYIQIVNAGKFAQEETDINPDRGLILEEENGAGQPVQVDTSVLSPAANNVAARSTGEYAEQIDQQAINEKAEIEGFLVAKSGSEINTPSSTNRFLKPGGESAPEVDQYEIIKKANLEGYDLPDVDPGSHPPTNINVLSQPDSEYAEEINL